MGYKSSWDFLKLRGLVNQRISKCDVEAFRPCDVCMALKPESPQTLFYKLSYALDVKFIQPTLTYNTLRASWWGFVL